MRAASLRGHKDIVRKLIEIGADVNTYSKEPQCSDKVVSILHLALKSETRGIFELLIANGADINVVIADEQHTMISACQHGNQSLVKLLLDNGVSCNVSGLKSRRRNYIRPVDANSLYAACSRGDVSLVRLLVAHGAELEKSNEPSDTPLLAGIRHRHLPDVQLLLNIRADVNHAVDETPVMQAPSGGNLEIMEALLEKGANIPEHRKKTTLSNALAIKANSQ